VALLASGREALAAVPLWNPRLVLIDVRMPEMDGIETVRRLRSGGTTARLVLMSVEPVQSLPSETTACGADAVIAKGVLTPTWLRSALDDYGRSPAER